MIAFSWPLLSAAVLKALTWLDLSVENKVFGALLAIQIVVVVFQTIRRRRAPRLLASNSTRQIEKPVQLAGMVYGSDNNQPIRAAKITAYSEETGKIYKVRSNADGWFRIPVIPGLYSVTIECDGYGKATGMTRVDERSGYADFGLLEKLPKK